MSCLVSASSTELSGSEQQSSRDVSTNLVIIPPSTILCLLKIPSAVHHAPLLLE